MTKQALQVAELSASIKLQGGRYQLEPSFAEYLNEAIEMAGTTGKEMAHAIGLSPTTVYAILNGTTKSITRKTYRKLDAVSFFDTGRLDLPDED